MHSHVNTMYLTLCVLEILERERMTVRDGLIFCRKTALGMGIMVDNGSAYESKTNTDK